MNLLSAFPGKRYVVVKIKDPIVRQQAGCLGMGEGEDVCCIARKANGPVTLGRGGQMVAVGGEIARGILIVPWRPRKK
mgnify:CR=1 FL=1